MYSSAGQCVLLAVDKNLHAHLLGRMFSYEPAGGANEAWRTDLRGLIMACDIEEITTRLDTIISLLEQDAASAEPLDDDILQKLELIVTLLGYVP